MKTIPSEYTDESAYFQVIRIKKTLNYPKFELSEYIECAGGWGWA